MSKMNYRDLIAARKIKEEFFFCTAANLIDLVSKCHHAIVDFVLALSFLSFLSGGRPCMWLKDDNH